MENQTTAIEYLAKDKAVYVGQVTEKQILAWKETHKKGIFQLTDEEGLHVGYFRNPMRGDVNYAFQQADGKDNFSVPETLAKLLWLGGYDRMLKDDEIFLGIVGPLRSKMNGVKVSLVNL